ncbi:SMP-30/gluconolactonase/LRE family protein [Paraburkholderia tropica]|uniref:SMP-30/gluconolactonase/LRE family protein n=1 Tax=Paraburkholderia tropica TaxID=92647 RepID=UPI002AAFFA70|nr:SMP-30/gluconolactonase/LRE family protein [Paraburkholderia tropica]
MPSIQNPLKGWQLQRSDISYVGHDLRRPECILAQSDGTLWTADARGGIMRIAADGQQTLIAGVQTHAQLDEKPSVERVILEGTLPNGVAFDSNGDFLIANFGTDRLELMRRDGSSTVLHDNIDGEPIGKANFVLTDSKGRIYMTVTTRLQPWTRSINEKTPDGYIALIDGKGIRIVADGFVGTNEIRFDANEEWLYVVESNGKRISRLRVREDGTLGEREIFGPSNLGTGFPDGFAFDVFGNLWITMIMAERLIALTPEGDLLELFDDGVPPAVAAVERHYREGTVTPEILAACQGTVAPWMASVTFGGPDLRTVYLGSLLGNRLPCFRAPVAGLPLPHWHRQFDLKETA